MIRLLKVSFLLALGVFSTYSSSQPKGNLENPSEGGFYGGIQIISGWICDATEVEILIDGSEYFVAAYGTARLDTRDVCGDVNNGFGLLVNLANFGTGNHEAVLFADGQEIDRTIFNVTALSTGEFASDLEGCVVANDFPTKGHELELVWSEASQNFQIKKETASASTVKVDGKWTNSLNDLYIWTSYKNSDGQCSSELSMYASGLLGIRSAQPQLIDLYGSGSNGIFEMKSTASDAVQREVRLEIMSDGTLEMRTTKCPGPVMCEKTPEGSLIIMSRVLNPLDQDYLPPIR